MTTRTVALALHDPPLTQSKKPRLGGSDSSKKAPGFTSNNAKLGNVPTQLDDDEIVEISAPNKPKDRFHKGIIPVVPQWPVQLDDDEIVRVVPALKTKRFLAIKDGYIGSFRLSPPYHLAWEERNLTLHSTERPCPTAKHTDRIFVAAEIAKFKYTEFDDTSDMIFVLKRYPMQHAKGGPRFMLRPEVSRDKGIIVVNLGRPPRTQYEEFIAWMKPLVKRRSVIQQVFVCLEKFQLLNRVSDSAVNVIRNMVEMRGTGKTKGRSTATRKEEEESDDELGKWNNHIATDKSLKPPVQEQNSRQHSSFMEFDAKLCVPNSADPDAVLNADSKIELDSAAQSAPDSNSDEVILVYPTGQIGAVNITKGDMIRLRPNAFLNDTLIEFGYGCTGLYKDNTELAKQIHVFSSFFYHKLNQQSYASVAKWTSKFDLFEKKYIIVPINENLHWYLAIICYPEHVLKPELPPPPSTKVSPSTPSNTNTRSNLNLPSDEPMEVEVISPALMERVPFDTSNEPQVQPRAYIFTLDSLGLEHPRAGVLLDNYLRQEASEKKNMHKDRLNKATYKPALVPHQPNFCDCGLYLLHLVETFFSDPHKYANIVLSRKNPYAAADRARRLASGRNRGDA
ncbi:ULP-PROTEASE domain-containing protein [Mycena indigotica]|uniref:ULP-PROTEASE domain-containing protein n=1 Tax=Mycena indigotica TaxID=2126181 RepID=A0A8H6SGW9_9AGAR|nr:ULP-PROTEASE domain-containing protein [Mycena indigotica]KAF7298590.1 ULP-PROTEASE domain-containing protein [Mycena indigotica]